MTLKVNGFSVMELVISLLLSALLMGFGYYGYEMFTKEYQNKKMETEELEEINRFAKQLKRDFANAKEIRKIDDRIVITIQGDKINYFFEEDLVVRTHDYNDTLRVIINQMDISTIASENFDENLLVETASFSISFDNQSLPLYLVKEYPLDMFLNPNN